MHVCPEFENFAQAILSAACPISTSSLIIAGHLPPSSRIHGVRFLAASVATILPTNVLPVKQIRSSFYLLSSTATSTPPSMHLISSLSRYVSISFLTTLETDGAISDGFIRTAFPAVIA